MIDWLTVILLPCSLFGLTEEEYIPDAESVYLHREQHHQPQACTLAQCLQLYTKEEQVTLEYTHCVGITRPHTHTHTLCWYHKATHNGCRCIYMLLYAFKQEKRLGKRNILFLPEGLFIIPQLNIQ